MSADDTAKPAAKTAKPAAQAPAHSARGAAETAAQTTAHHHLILRLNRIQRRLGLVRSLLLVLTR